MLVKDWFNTEDYKKTEVVNFFSEGGRELTDEELLESEIIQIDRANGWYTVIVDAT